MTVNQPMRQPSSPDMAMSLAPAAPLRETAVAPLADAAVLPIAIPLAFQAEVLSPYRDNAKYLRSAEVAQFGGGEDGPLLTGRGRFSIPQSCYIDDTGHFNAVEFNICYNQLAYVVFGHCIASGVLAQLSPIFRERVPRSAAEFKRHQLPSMLIAKLAGRFSKQLRSDDFSGELRLLRVSAAGPAVFCFTSIAFANGDQVKSHGEVVLAFSPAGHDART
jgi:hypothetical protein